MSKKGRGGMEPAVPEQLPDLVGYSTGTVVSRTLAKSKAGTLTMFAFDEGEGLSEHTAPFDAFVQVVDGEADVTIDGKVIRAKTGDLVLMPANIPHALDAVTAFKMLLILIKG